MVDEKSRCTHAIFWPYDLFPFAVGSAAYWSDERRGWLAPSYGGAIVRPLAMLPADMPSNPLDVLATLHREYDNAAAALLDEYKKKAVAALPWLASFPAYKDKT